MSREKKEFHNTNEMHRIVWLAKQQLHNTIKYAVNVRQSDAHDCLVIYSTIQEFYTNQMRRI